MIKCHTCGLVTDRPGEKRPSVCCKKCKIEHCNQCAEVTDEICAMFKSMGKSLWTCNDCERNAANMQSVVTSIKSMNTELSAIRKKQEKQEVEQSEQKEERKKVMEGLKVVEAVAKKLEQIEETQEKHEERLKGHDDAIEKNTRKGEEGEDRIKKLEERMEKIEKIGKKGNETDNHRQFNDVVQEVREIERRDKNIVVFNVPETTEGEEEERTKADGDKITEILKELTCDGISSSKVVRIGKTGRHPKQMLVIFKSVEECEQVLRKSREGPKLKNDVFLTRDRTFRQRQEAKRFREAKENEERNQEMSAEQPQPVGGRGRGRGRSRGGGGRGRGGRGGRVTDSASRKRRNSGESETVTNVDEESKRRRTGAVTGLAAPVALGTATPAPSTSSELGAVGGAEEESF